MRQPANRTLVTHPVVYVLNLRWTTTTAAEAGNCAAPETRGKIEIEYKREVEKLEQFHKTML